VNVEHILASKGREVCTITPEATVSDALHRMRDEKVGALVVSADGARIAGIVSDRGIMWALADHGTEVLGESVRGVMTEKVFTCSRDDQVSAIMALMTERRIRHVPISPPISSATRSITVAVGRAVAGGPEGTGCPA
jgi:CBS domain-containing protein